MNLFQSKFKNHLTVNETKLFMFEYVLCDRKFHIYLFHKWHRIILFTLLWIAGPFGSNIKIRKREKKGNEIKNE